MNKNIARLGLAAVAAFYVVVGGLWASQYFPLQKFIAQSEVKDEITARLGYERAYESPEYKAATAYEETYALTHPGVMQTAASIAFYESLLFWATIAIGVGGGVLYLTRGRGGKAANGAAQ